MTIKEKNIEALKRFDDYVTISQWASKFGEIYPDELAKANEQAKNQKNDTTGLREIAARISSNLSTGRYNNEVSIDDSERPRKVKYITKEELDEQVTQELDEDIEPLKRADIINSAKDSLEIRELYRISEFESIRSDFKTFFSIDFEIDHAKALMNSSDKGEHHPDNLQLLIKPHNGRKNKNSWDRFSIDKQIEYIKQAIKLQSIVADKLDIKISDYILESLLDRLKKVY
jgi:hypothetical protein